MNRYLILIVGVILFCNCRKNLNEVDTRAAIKGEVRVTSKLTDPDGSVIGDTVLLNIEGVKCFLMKDGIKVDSIRTYNGKYKFQNVDVGSYTVVAMITNDIFITSSPIYVDSENLGDVVTTEPLNFSSYNSNPGSLTLCLPLPNPFQKNAYNNENL